MATEVCLTENNLPWNMVDEGNYIFPYKFTDDKGSIPKEAFLLAKRIEEKTCLRFRPWKGESSWLNLSTVEPYYRQINVAFGGIGRFDSAWAIGENGSRKEGQRKVSIIFFMIVYNIKLF